MRLSKETVAKREARAAELFKQGMDVEAVNNTLFQEDGHRMAVARLNELRDKHAPVAPKVKELPPVLEEPKELFKRVELSNPEDFSKHTTLFKGKIVTLTLMEP